MTQLCQQKHQNERKSSKNDYTNEKPEKMTRIDTF